MAGENSINDDATSTDSMDEAIKTALSSNAPVDTSTEQQGLKDEPKDEPTDQPKDEPKEIDGLKDDIVDEPKDEPKDEPTDSDIIDLDHELEDQIVDEPKDEPSETDINPFKEILSGEFEDEEDLQSYVEDLESDREELEKLRESGQKPKFANDLVEKLNDYVENGGKAENFMRVQGVNVDNMNAVDRLTTEIMWNNPDFSKEDAIRYLERKFPDSLDDEGELDPNDPVLRADGNKAATEIKKIQAEDITPERKGDGKTQEEWEKEYLDNNQKETEIHEEEEEERMLEWFPNVDKAIEKVQDEGILIPIGETGKGFRFKVEADDDYLGQIKDRVENSLKDIGLSVKDNPKMADSLLKSSIILDKLPEIVKSFGTKVENFKDEEWFQKMNNPSAIKRGDVVSKETKLPTASEGLEGIMKL